MPPPYPTLSKIMARAMIEPPRLAIEEIIVFDITRNANASPSLFDFSRKLPCVSGVVVWNYIGSNEHDVRKKNVSLCMRVLIAERRPLDRCSEPPPGPPV